MKKILTLAVIATTLLSAACSKSDDGGTYDAPIAVQIDPTIADPALFPKASTRVTDTDFETGDKIGVTITMESDNSAFLSNKEFSFDGTTFTAPGTLWYEDVNLTSTLFAYYPCQAGATHPAEFSVQTDQTGDNYKASDLVIGVKAGVKPQKVVDLAFKHKMTRVIIRVTNGTDSELTEIRIGGSIGTGTIDAATGAFTAKTDAAVIDVKACEWEKNKLYYALLVPQNGVKLVTTFTTADGKTRSYTLGTTDLVSGTNRELKMNIQPADLQIELGGQIDGWDNGADLELDSGGHVVEPTTPTIAWGGVDYKIVTLKDGRTWMAENLRYVPEGKTVSENYEEEADGIWYPLMPQYDETQNKYVGVVTKDNTVVQKNGYLYTFAAAMQVDAITEENSATFEGKQGICPDGYHIPTEAEWVALIAAYPKPDNAKQSFITDLETAGFPCILAGMRQKNNSAATGAVAGACYEDHLMGGYIMSSTKNKFEIKNEVTTTQNKNFMLVSNASNQHALISNASNFAGISVRCIKNAE